MKIGRLLLGVILSNSVFIADDVVMSLVFGLVMIL